MSNLELTINKLVAFILTLQMALCVSAAVGSSIWLEQNSAFTAFLDFKEPVGLFSFINFFTYFLLLNTFLPVSLAVSLEIVKVVQARFIDYDTLMFSFEREELAVAKTASIVEELGQVNYIFSDKTGTLTRNVMEFKSMLIGDEFYGDR